MTAAAQKLLEQVLLLPDEDRAALVDELLGSLDSATDAENQVAWEKEIARRLQAIDNGTARLVPWEEVRQRLLGKANESAAP